MERVIISADSHVMEPADLWTARVDPSLRDIAPQVRKNDDGPGYRTIRWGRRASASRRTSSRPVRRVGIPPSA